MIIGTSASSITANLASIFSLATTSPAYKAGLATNASVTHTTSDLSAKTQVASNTPSFGAFGWTL